MSGRLFLKRSTFATLFNVYALTLVTSKTKTVFYDSLEIQLNRVPSADKTITLGDFNARVGIKHNVLCGVLRRRHGIGSCNDNGLRLLHLCSEDCLCITNALFLLKDLYKTT